MTDSHYARLKPYVVANPNAAGFLVEVDAIKASGRTGEDLEDAIVDLAIKTITMIQGRRAEP
jgi:hypothetical protein